MSENMQWNELQELCLEGGAMIRPGLPQRVLAAVARRRAALQENLRVMVVATFALSLLILGGIEYDARTVAPIRLAQGDQGADWVHNFDQ